MQNGRATTAPVRKRAGAIHTVDPDETSERNHELRASLCGIEAAALALREQRDRMPGGQVDALAEAIASEARRLQSLLSPHEPRESVFDVVDAIRPAVLMTRSLGVDVGVVLHGPTWVHGSRDDVAQAVLALLDNARKHAAPSPVEVRITEAGGVVTLHVEDRGPGFDEADTERIFWRGRRNPASFGSGLGLFIARQLVTRQGGCLTAAPRPGGGASFVLSLRSAASRTSADSQWAARRPAFVR